MSAPFGDLGKLEALEVLGPDLLVLITPLRCLLGAGRCRTCGVALANQLSVMPAGRHMVVLSCIPTRRR